MTDRWDTIAPRLTAAASPVVVEAGVHRGEDTRRFLDLNPNVVVYGFEPDPRNVEAIVQSGLAGRIRFTASALGARTGRAELHLSYGGTQSSSIKEPRRHRDRWPDITFPEKVEVPVVSLDDFFRHDPPPRVDLLWLDCQGAELDVIEGGRTVVARAALVLCEYSTEELYAGQADLPALTAALGPGWRVLHDFGGDALIENAEVV